VPKRRLKGSRAKGITYEHKVQRHLRDLAQELGVEFHAQQWLQFSDADGLGFAQPDAFVVFEDEVLLFEAKLTQSDQAQGQCLELYVPLLENIYSRPCVACQVFKNIRYTVPEMIEYAFELRGKKGYWQWHNPMI
jgi:hypothetical protein